MDQLEKIIRENCWKFDKGYPDSQEDIDYLKTLIEQEFTSTSTAGDNVEVTYDNIEDVPVEDIEDVEDELEKKFDDEQLDSAVEIQKALRSIPSQVLKANNLEDIDLDDIANYMMNRRLKPILADVLRDNNYNEKIIDEYVAKIMPIFRNIDNKERDKLIAYLQNPTVEFGKNPNGNLYTDFKKIPAKGLPYEEIVRTTFQDEKKLGVGMGEVAMAIFFKNVKSSTGGGDLEIDDGKFEVKGYNAKLERDPDNYRPKVSDLKKLGIKFKEDNKTVDYKRGKFAETLQNAYAQSKNKQQWIVDFKEMLANGPKLPMSAINTRVDQIDWNSTDSISRNIGLINFIRYAGSEQGFEHFIVHDTGSTDKGKGEYVYVGGSPEDMAQDLYDAGVQFQAIAPNLLGGPRVVYKNLEIEENDV